MFLFLYLVGPDVFLIERRCRSVQTCVHSSWHMHRHTHAHTSPS